jgi:Flp pilus assembly protein TadB
MLDSLEVATANELANRDERSVPEERNVEMAWKITAAFTVALAAVAALFGGAWIAVVLLVAVPWLTLALRPVEAGTLVAELARRRFD